jgi:hypothetical protein
MARYLCQAHVHLEQLQLWCQVGDGSPDQEAWCPGCLSEEITHLQNENLAADLLDFDEEA